MNEKSPSAKNSQKIISAGIIGLLIAGVFLSRFLGEASPGIPNHLSCGIQSSPEFWENGSMIFDFENGMMTTSGQAKKVYKSDRIWSENGDRIMSIIGFLDVSTGAMVSKTDTLRLSLSEKIEKKSIRVTLSSDVNSNSEPLQLMCLSK